jgi:DNA-binding SARP family transcriptional activator
LLLRGGGGDRPRTRGCSGKDARRLLGFCRLWVDLEAFETAAAAVRRGRDPAACRAALDLYAGGLLPADRYEEWAEEKRGEIRRLYLDLLMGLARAYEERGDLGQAVETLQMAVAKEPTLEEAHAGLMRL